jgi:hypothetical protein
MKPPACIPTPAREVSIPAKLPRIDRRRASKNHLQGSGEIEEIEPVPPVSRIKPLAWR